MLILYAWWIRSPPTPIPTLKIDRNNDNDAIDIWMNDVQN